MPLPRFPPEGGRRAGPTGPLTTKGLRTARLESMSKKTLAFPFSPITPSNAMKRKEEGRGRKGKG